MITKPFPRAYFARILPRGLVAVVLAWVGLGMDGHPARAAGTIQDLINGATAGSTVQLPPGTYLENLTIQKNLTLAGDAGGTIIQPPAGAPGVTLGSHAAVTIQDLTITGASLTGGVGGGILGLDSILVVQRCTLSNNTAKSGGGIYFEKGSLTIQDSTIIENHASENGGGIFSAEPLTLTNTIVRLNTAGGYGGGVSGWAGLVTINDGELSNNTATGNGGGLNVNDDLTINGTAIVNNISGADGGGVHQWNPNKTINVTNAWFAGNSARTNGGGMAAKGNLTLTGGTFYMNMAGDEFGSSDAFGGGLYLEDGALNLQGTVFRNNRARCEGCGQNAGGGLMIANSIPNQVADAVFEGNKAMFGGGLFQSKRVGDTRPPSSLTVLRSTFLNNEASIGGGLHGMNVTVRESIFDRNTSGIDAGGMRLGGVSVLERLRVIGNSTLYPYSRGAGIYLTGSATLRNSVISDNHLLNTDALGSAIYIDPSAGLISLQQLTLEYNTGGTGAGLHVDGGSVTMTNIISSSHIIGVCVNGGSASIDGVLWYNNGSNTGSGLPGCPGVPSVTHEIAGNPRFAADGFHITSGSPAYNAGVTTSITEDIDGEMRPQFGQYDLGADELVYWVYLPALTR